MKGQSLFLQSAAMSKMKDDHPKKAKSPWVMLGSAPILALVALLAGVFRNWALLVIMGIVIICVSAAAWCGNTGIQSAVGGRLMFYTFCAGGCCCCQVVILLLFCVPILIIPEGTPCCDPCNARCAFLNNQSAATTNQVRLLSSQLVLDDASASPRMLQFGGAGGRGFRGIGTCPDSYDEICAKNDCPRYCTRLTETPKAVAVVQIILLVIVAICLCGVCGAGYLLRQEVTSFGQGGDGHVMPQHGSTPTVLGVPVSSTIGVPTQAGRPVQGNVVLGVQ